MGKHFSYSFTCPEIDKNIRHFQSELSYILDNAVKELNPLFYSSVDSTHFLKDLEDSVYSSAETYFENVRDCNSTMRDEVEKVVEEIVEERDEYKRLSEVLEDESIEKDKQIEALKEEIENLKYQIENL